MLSPPVKAPGIGWGAWLLDLAKGVGVSVGKNIGGVFAGDINSAVKVGVSGSAFAVVVLGVIAYRRGITISGSSDWLWQFMNNHTHSSGTTGSGVTIYAGSSSPIQINNDDSKKYLSDSDRRNLNFTEGLFKLIQYSESSGQKLKIEFDAENNQVRNLRITSSSLPIISAIAGMGSGAIVESSELSS